MDCTRFTKSLHRLPRPLAMHGNLFCFFDSGTTSDETAYCDHVTTGIRISMERMHWLGDLASGHGRARLVASG